MIAQIGSSDMYVGMQTKVTYYSGNVVENS